MWGPGRDVDRALGRARELAPSQEPAPRPAPPQAPPPWCASHKHGAPEKIQVILSKQPSNTYLFVTLFSVGWLLHCVIFCLASCLIPEIVLNPLVLFYQIFMVDIYGKLMSKQDGPGGTFLGRHMGLGRFALLIHSCVALLLNLCSVFCHLWQKVSKSLHILISLPDLHCFALCYVFSLAFLSSSDFIAGVLTTLFRLTC